MQAMIHQFQGQRQQLVQDLAPVCTRHPCVFLYSTMVFQVPMNMATRETPRKSGPCPTEF